MNSEEERPMGVESTNDDSANVNDLLWRSETANVADKENALPDPAKHSIGHSEEVNGPGAVEHYDFQADREELLELVKYWWKVALDMRLFCFIYETFGVSDLREITFAEHRVAQIAECVGHDLVNEAIESAEQEFTKTADPETWRVFKEGTPEEIAAFHAETRAKLYSALDRKTD